MTFCVSLLAVLCVSSCDNKPKQEPVESFIDRGLKRATEQALLMAKELENQEGKFPKSVKDGKLETSNYSWWCSGFFPGQLWYLYEADKSKELKRYAELFTERLEKAKTITYSHDLGFMLNCSYGNGYRLTKNPKYREVLIEGAHSLATRFNPKVGLVRSWDFNKKVWQYPVIIDNMMNLEYLMWAARETGDESFKKIAVSHADKTMQNHFRPNMSCYHVVSYDTITGQPHKKQTHQGFADESTWARGEAWALYGYTMMYRETGKQEYLDQANYIAMFMMNHPTMPADKVPYWDFDCPDIPNTVRDASAAAIMASALIELSQFEKNKNDFGKKCLVFAERQLRTLTSSKYLAKTGTNCNFVLMHSTGNYPGKSEVDVPLTYADYYYVEALLRLKKVVENQ